MDGLFLKKKKLGWVVLMVVSPCPAPAVIIKALDSLEEAARILPSLSLQCGKIVIFPALSRSLLAKPEKPVPSAHPPVTWRTGYETSCKNTICLQGTNLSR